MEGQSIEQLTDLILNADIESAKGYFSATKEKVPLFENLLTKIYSAPITRHGEEIIAFSHTILKEPFTPVESYLDQLYAIGKLYSDITHEDQTANIRLAIDFFTLAYQVAKANLPELYRLNISWFVAYNFDRLGDAEDKEQAIRFMKEAIAIASAEKEEAHYLPNLYLGLGEYYANRSLGDFLENKRMAITCFNQSLGCLTEELEEYTRIRISSQAGLAENYCLVTDENWTQNLNKAISYYDILVQESEEAIDSDLPENLARWYVLLNCCYQIRQVDPMKQNQELALAYRAKARNYWDEEAIKQEEITFFTQLSDAFDQWYPFEEHFKYHLIKECLERAIINIDEQENKEWTARIYIRCAIAQIMIGQYLDRPNFDYSVYNHLLTHLKWAINLVLERTDNEEWSYRSLQVIPDDQLKRYYFEYEIANCIEVVSNYREDELYYSVLCELISLMYLYRSTGRCEYNVTESINWRKKALIYHNNSGSSEVQITLYSSIALDVLKHTDFRMIELAEEGIKALLEAEKLMLYSPNAQNYLAYDLEFVNLYYCMLETRIIISSPDLSLEKMANDAFKRFENGNLLQLDKYCYFIGKFYQGLWYDVRRYGDFQWNAGSCCACMKFIINAGKVAPGITLPDYLVGMAHYFMLKNSYALSSQGDLNQIREYHFDKAKSFLKLDEYPIEYRWLISKFNSVDETILLSNNLKKHEATEKIRLKYQNISDFNVSINYDEPSRSEESAYKWLIDYYRRNNNPKEALKYLMYNKSRVEVDKLFIKTPIQQRQEWTSHYNILKDLQNQHSLLQWRLGNDSALFDPSTRRELELEINAVQNQIDRTIGTMRLLFSPLSDIAYRELINPDAILDLMQTSDSTLIEYYFDGANWIAFIVNPSGFYDKVLKIYNPTVEPVEDDDELKNERYRFESEIDEVETFIQDLLYNYQQNVPVNEGVILKKLYAALIKPFEELLTTRNIIIGVTRNLFIIPFNALPNTNNQRLGDTFDLTIISSCSFYDALLRSGQSEAEETSEALLTVTHSGTAATFLPVLPSVRQESDAIASNFNQVKPLTDGAASSEEVIGVCANEAFAAIHFGCHAHYKDGNPHHSSGMWLSDFFSINTVINELKLKGRPIVSLACCQSGYGYTNYDGNVISIAQSFLIAGASVVVANIWSVNDEASKTFYETFYALKFNRKLSTRAAFKAAIDTIRSNPKWRNPYYWAGYYLTGLIN